MAKPTSFRSSPSGPPDDPIGHSPWASHIAGFLFAVLPAFPPSLIMHVLLTFLQLKSQYNVYQEAFISAQPEAILFLGTCSHFTCLLLYRSFHTFYLFSLHLIFLLSHNYIKDIVALFLFVLLNRPNILFLEIFIQTMNKNALVTLFLCLEFFFLLLYLKYFSHPNEDSCISVYVMVNGCWEGLIRDW